MVFLPNPRKIYSQTRFFGLINLSFLILKVLEKLVDRYMRETSLSVRPLHPNQHTYEPGKSCKYALHQLVVRIEGSLYNREMALPALLDVDRSSFDIVLSAVNGRGVWLNYMLREGQKYKCLAPQLGCLLPKDAHREGYYRPCYGI